MILSGCAAVVRNALPREYSDSARVPGFSVPVRFWGDRPNPALGREAVRAAAHDTADGIGSASALVLTGGGDGGAFGAGLLCGWSARGDRPTFRAVAGVSTGALIAPLAFLSPRYDNALRAAYTSVEFKDILEVRSYVDWLRYDSIADSRPLQDITSRLITERVLREIAREHARGRRLYIQTVNLDAQRPVIWDMGAIASIASPDAAKLFRRIMVASASFPGVFPPQYLHVEACGRDYDEMHVDGSIISQMVLNSSAADWAAAFQRPGGERARIYVIRNGRALPAWQATSPRTLPIAERALITMTKSQADADLALAYYRARETKGDYFTTSLPGSYVRKSPEEFNKEEMNRMFQIGYDLARQGSPWQKAPSNCRPPETP